MNSKLILHRGYKGKYLENSLTALKHALKEGLPTEIDIRVSKDNVPVIIHDDTLDKLFNGAGKIEDKTLEELKQFRYKEDENEKIAMLEEFCEAMLQEKNKKSFVIIHMKELEDISQTIGVIQKYSFNERFWFFAVDEIEEKFRRIMREKYPEYKLGLYLPENSENYNEKHFKEFDFIWADEITMKWITKDKVDLAHKLNRTFYAISPELIPESIFNSNIARRWKELLEAGVDGICTDFPERFLNYKF